jgi:hypothetical protein
MRKMSILAVGIALLTALSVTATAAADGTFSAPIYGNTGYTCHGGAVASGETHGTFTVTEHTGSPWVNASITIRGTLYPNRTYDVSVVQGTGSYCTTTDSDIAEFTTDSSGRAPIVHFTFYQHNGSTFGWVKIQHGSTSDVYRSQSVPLNK